MSGDVNGFWIDWVGREERGEEKDLPSGSRCYVLTCGEVSDFICGWDAEQRESV